MAGALRILEAPILRWLYVRRQPKPEDQDAQSEESDGQDRGPHFSNG